MNAYYDKGPTTAQIDVRGLEAALKRDINGEVRFDTGSKSMYSTDASNYRQIPIGVVMPKGEEDIIKTVALCRKFKAPLLSRGGGTSLAGQCCNVAVVMDMSKYYNEVLNFDKERNTIKVQPGIVLDEVNKHVENANLIFGPDPATHDHCTIGGMLGNNSCGVHSIMAAFSGTGARMEDNIESMTILTYDGLKMQVGPVSEDELKGFIAQNDRKGQIYRQLKELRDFYEPQIKNKFPDIPRRVSGYNLPELFTENDFNLARALVGSEGTCVVILDVTLKLIPTPDYRSLLLLGFPNIFEAGHLVPDVMKHKPIGLEGIDHRLVEFMKKKHLHTDDLSLLPDGKGWLLVEFGGKNKEEADKKARNLMDELEKGDDHPKMKLYDKHSKESKIWEIRESGLGATAWVPGEDASFPGWEDSAVPPEKIGDYLKDLRELFDKYDYHPALYGHFGQGCVHCRVEFDLFTDKGRKRYEQFTIEAAKLVTIYGGSLSGEHGDGQARADLLHIMYGEELMQAFKDFKTIWDPEWKMNPGKIIEGYGQLHNLRIGENYKPSRPETHFSFPEDNGNFAHTALRCVGVGKCRRHEHGTMCPSYMVTREEKHSTRGRARLLFEMLQGDITEDTWKNDDVKEALDLCLACKGCKGDCPVNVDMATYKAEFLSHYYKGRVRPRTAYAFGFIYRWAKIASKIPRIANWLTHAPVISQISKKLAGVAPQRTMPSFAKKSFSSIFYSKHHKSSSHQPRVILWPDTFNNFFKTDTLLAGEKVLKAAGYDVIIPEKILCCGRPLYDFGMLDLARGLLDKILNELQTEIKEGTPIVGMEPSCVAVFRDELCNLIPNNNEAKNLKKQTFTLSEFLINEANFNFPVYNKKAIVHAHCHHGAVMKFDDDIKVLDQLQLDYELLDSGCCGMAGYFGYEEGSHYDVSIKAGERVLLPKVREVSEDTLIIADGFSCREQIEQETGRKALHLAEVIALALEQTQTRKVKPENELQPYQL